LQLTARSVRPIGRNLFSRSRQVMSLQVSDREFAAVTRLAGPARYDHTIKRIADWLQIWCLRFDDGWACVANDQQERFFPIWPAERYAAACASGRVASGQPAAIAVQVWLDTMTPNFVNEGTGIAVFPVTESGGVTVTAAQFAVDLQAELTRYE